MLYDIHVKREFLDGPLKGITMDQVIPYFPEKPEIGEVRECGKPLHGMSPYRDTVVKIEIRGE